MTMDFTEGLIIAIAGVFETYLLLVLMRVIEVEKIPPTLILIAVAIAAGSCVIMGVRAMVAAFLKIET